MAINSSRVVAGGLVAGLVMNVVAFIVNGLLLSKRMEAEMLAVAPTLQGRGMSGGVIASRVITQFLVGILLVWLYAAIRPRFGAGPKTAAIAGLIVWCFGFIFYLDWLYVDLISVTSYAIISVIQLISLMIAAWIGGKIYTEQGAPAVV